MTDDVAALATLLRTKYASDNPHAEDIARTLERLQRDLAAALRLALDFIKNQPANHRTAAREARNHGVGYRMSDGLSFYVWGCATRATVRQSQAEA